MGSCSEFPFSELCGAIHIHTRFSDGEVDFQELISAAQEVGLDYIVVTDHMTLEGKERHYEGVYNNLLVVIGYEHNDLQDKNHYLIMGVDTVIEEQHSPQKYIAAVKDAGGIGFLAHPAEKRRYFKQYPSYPWTAWEVTGYDGIELWNHMSEWVENLKSWRSYIRIFYPRRFLKGAPHSLIKRWDKINRERFVSGIGGVDAHTFHIRKGIFSIQIFPIKVELKGIRTHLYIDNQYKETEFSSKIDILLTALKNGSGFISNYRRGDARGTRMAVQFADGTCIPPGYCDELPVYPANLSVTIPAKAEIRLIQNGREVGRKSGDTAEFELHEKGLYRIEVYRRKKAWIYSNPFPLGTYPLY